MSAGDPYTYAGSNILRNRLGLTDATELDRIERLIVAERLAEGVPSGGFDLDHLRAIHHHLFQDIYAWAGEIRTVELVKGDHQFQFRHHIETGMADVYRRLRQSGFLRDLDQADFVVRAGQIMGDINYVHPFREGNGRTQLLYLEQLAEQASHPIDLTRLDAVRWVEASRAAHNADYDLMAEQIAQAMRSRDDGQDGSLVMAPPPA